MKIRNIKDEQPVHLDMSEEQKKEWIDALRSGKYNQGSNMLYNKKNDTFCCLGVFANAVIGESEEAMDRISYIDILYIEESVQETFAAYNDGDLPFKPATFDDIADYLEKCTTE